MLTRDKNCACSTEYCYNSVIWVFTMLPVTNFRNISLQIQQMKMSTNIRNYWP